MIEKKFCEIPEFREFFVKNSSFTQKNRKFVVVVVFQLKIFFTYSEVVY